MKKKISFLLIFCFLLIILLPDYLLAQENRILIQRIKGDKFVANVGTTGGATTNSIYLINRGNSIIGKAKVLLVKDNICAMQILSILPGRSVQIGDRLLLAMDSFDPELIDVLNILDESTEEKSQKNSEITKDNTNYYFQGRMIAENEYTGSGANGTGVVCGLLFGLIGWGIGALVISGNEINVPTYHYYNLDQNNQLQFTTGYKDYVSKKRMNSFHKGAVIGVLMSASLYLVFSSNQN